MFIHGIILLDPLPFSRIKRFSDLFCHLLMVFIHVVFDMALVPHLSPSPLPARGERGEEGEGICMTHNAYFSLS